MRVLSLFLFFSQLFISVAAATETQPQLAPVAPGFQRYLDRSRPSKSPAEAKLPATAEPRSTGYLPSPNDYSHLRGKASLIRPQTFPSQIQRAYAPLQYDLRTYGRVTSIRDQGACGACWTFGSLASLESALLPAATFDFSENNLKNTSGFDWPTCSGGNPDMAIAYLSRWSGPVTEAEDPYSAVSALSPVGLAPQKHMREVLIIPGRGSALDNDGLKQAIMDYGAITTSIYVDGGATTSTNSSYYQLANSAYYYNGAADSNHIVALVGWDDTYSAANFSTQPPGNGAFIVKNSWGPSWGSSGYFHISYYDAVVGNENYVFNSADDPDLYATIYQYDWLGKTGSSGYFATTAWFANIFTATESETLAAVSFHTNDINAAYEVFIYQGVATGEPRSGSQSATFSGTLPYPGYHTLTVPTPVSLVNGERFSVVVRVTNPTDTYPIPLEQPINGYTSTAGAGAGQSFMSANGSSWQDVSTQYANTNVALKAFTQSSSVVVTATASTGGGVTPGSRTISSGATASFPVSTDSGYTRSSVVGGTCPSGSWDGDTYTTGVITGDCAVSFLFTPTSNCSAYAIEWVNKSYVSYYGRPADPGGLEYWACRMDSEGGNLASIIGAFGVSDEFTARYGSQSNDQLIDTIYQQMFNREPDPVGKAHYLDKLNTGAMNLQTITLNVLGGAVLWPDSTIIANKLQVASYFTDKLKFTQVTYNGGRINAARDILSTVNETTSTRDQAVADYDALIASWLSADQLAIIAVTPAADATGVPIATPLAITFSVPMDSTSLNSGTIQLEQSDGSPVSGTVSYADLVATFTPTEYLDAGQSYTATLSTGIRSSDGYPLATPYTWSFTVDASGALSDNTLIKEDGVAPPPPMSIVPERPISGQAVTVTVTAPGSTAIGVTLDGAGCGTLAAGSGPSPLTITGTAGNDGYCDLTATASYASGPAQVLAGHFEVQSTAPDLPPLTLEHGVYEMRRFPGVSAADIRPTITAIDGPPGFINGGSATYTVSYSGPQEIKDVLVQVPGYEGFFRVPVTTANGTLTFTVNFSRDFFQAQAPASAQPQRAGLMAATASSTLDLLVTVEDLLGAISQSFALNLNPQEVTNGEVKVSIAWDTPTDVDLHVTEPSGETIYYRNLTSDTGGTLDLDSNAGCDIDNINNENIVWPVGQAPNGEFTVRVHMYESPCGDPPGSASASGTVTITFCGDDSPQSIPFTLAGEGSEETFTFTSLCGSRVSGTVRYEDFPVTDAGLGAGAMVPVRFAKVQVLRASDAFILADGNTDAAGKYDITFVNDEPTEPGFYVQVLAQQNSSSLKQVVQDLDGNIYAFRSPKADEPPIDESQPPPGDEGFTVDIDVEKADDAGALNIFDVGLEASLYTWSHTGTTPSNLTFKWTAGQLPLGKNSSFFRPATTAIYVLGNPADPDEYDDVIIGHEYGHYVMAKYSVDNSPGGAHSSNSQSVPTLAWSEAWATFFACSSQKRSSYADTNANGMGGFYSIETLPPAKPLGNKDNKLEGALSEAVGAAVLMDLFDSSNETNDTLAGKSTAIWGVLRGYLAFGNAKYSDRGVPGRDLVDFLDGWFCLGYGDKGATATEGVQGIVKTLHTLSYDFPELPSCK